MQAKKQTVWIVDDDQSIRFILEKTLDKAGFQVEAFCRCEPVLQRLEQTLPDVIMSDIRMPGIDGISLLAQIKIKCPDLPIIIMTAYSDLARTVSAYRAGAFEYLTKPFDVDDVVQLVCSALNHQADKQAAIPPTPDQQNSGLLGDDPAMQMVFKAIGRLSSTHLTVLITGESGTGKELVANALHQHSPRASKPFIAINTAAITKELLESALFGHEKGAFTGAATQHAGYFEQADGGTLFLDEIGDMPMELQTRLLRILAQGEFYRLGGRHPIKADVRIIAATHQDLEQLVKQHQFREDLLHRLNVISLHVPALRERRRDIPILAKHFLNLVARELNKQPKQLRPETMHYLSTLPWPGNVRQLANSCRWLTVMVTGHNIAMDDLPPELQTNKPTASTADWQILCRQWARTRLLQGDTDLLKNIAPLFETILIEEALQQTQGHRQNAAKLLGIGRNTLTRKLKQLGLD